MKFFAFLMMCTDRTKLQIVHCASPDTDFGFDMSEINVGRHHDAQPFKRSSNMNMRDIMYTLCARNFVPPVDTSNHDAASISDTGQRSATLSNRSIYINLYLLSLRVHPYLLACSKRRPFSHLPARKKITSN